MIGTVGKHWKQSPGRGYGIIDSIIEFTRAAEEGNKIYFFFDINLFIIFFFP